MNILPKNALNIKVEHSTVDFMKYEVDKVLYYYFDCTKVGHPEPMINAMLGLQLLKDTDVLIMIHTMNPVMLFPKIKNDFDFITEQLDDNIYKISFTRINTILNTDFLDTKCEGL